MAGSETSAKRRERLQSAIDAARARMSSGADLHLGGIASLLEELSDDLNQSARLTEEREAHARLDSVESRLADAEVRIADASRSGG